MNPKDLVAGLRTSYGCRQSRRFLRLVGFLILLWLPLIPVVGDARAVGADPYTIAGIRVDQTDTTAAAARERALASAHREAFSRLVARLVVRSDQTRLPLLPIPQIISMVHNFAITDEKTSGVRYLATITFRFRSGLVRDYFRSHGVRFADTLSKPVLILPVYETAGALFLWDQPNPWFEAWKTLPDNPGLMPLIIPDGDYLDIRSLTAEQALAGDRKRLAAIGERYGASSVISIHARHHFKPVTFQQTLEVAMRWYGDLHDGRSASLSHALADTDVSQTAITVGARTTRDWIEKDWKQANLFQFEQSGTLIVRVPLRQLQDWIDIRSRLTAVTLLQKLRLLSVSRQEAIVMLDHYSSGPKLRLAAAQQDLVLEPGVPYWQLHLSRQEKRSTRP